ncbi:class I SAM-dependent methyltransferase [Chelatococcus reniformis]|uniref:ATP synthase subunit beta n=1 Tax=Chelatococcus reniformis TaxID=1494448 RepID=A0A916UN65_9HYPH|nr:SAM-dependent methyltransferase [Chelatococcus reniformis]GGC80304.1 ATP synthase subunit beta [Chelatococcus reniformis]
MTVRPRTPLGDELCRLIAAEGPISVERYMGLCLTHPRHGYYTGRDPLGAAGDFTTAPEVSQIFGELIGLWVAAVWQTMGEPALVRLVELGPGRGTLMADAWRATRVLPRFRDALRVDLVEVSPVLRQRQQATLAVAGLGAGAAVTWRQRLEEVPDDGPLLVVANEFVDALPVRQFVRGSRGWHERLVGLSQEGELVFGLAEAAEPTLATSTGAPGAVLEVGRAAAAVARELAGRLLRQGGAALLIDYGHTATGLGDTLQAVRRHAYVDPLAEPGLADLTTHVDFGALRRTALGAGAAVHGPVPQGAFLDALGAPARAARLAAGRDAGTRAAIAAAVARLTGGGPGEMGELFKVMAIAAPALPALPGLEQGAIG